MSEEEKNQKQYIEKLFYFFDQKFGGKPCPVCGENSKRVLMNTEYNSPIMTSKEGFVADMYALFCDNCYNITLFAKGIIDDELRNK